MDPNQHEHGEPSFQNFHVDPLTPPPTAEQPMWQPAAPMSPAPYLLPPQAPVAPPPAPKRSGLAGFWNHPVVIASIMGTLVLLVTALTVITVVALKKDPADDHNTSTGNQANQPGTGTSPTPRRTSTDDGSGPGSGSGQNEATPSTDPSAAGSGDVFLNGRLELNLYGGESGDAVDLDTAKKNYSFNDGVKYDLVIGSTALNMKNKAKVHKLAGTAAPTQSACTDGAQWADSAHISTLAVDAVLCVQSSDGRVGALTITAVDKGDDGRLDSIGFDYVIWKKSGDQ
jgi:hypothetical protein